MKRLVILLCVLVVGCGSSSAFDGGTDDARVGLDGAACPATAEECATVLFCSAVCFYDDASMLVDGAVGVDSPVTPLDMFVDLDSSAVADSGVDMSVPGTDGGTVDAPMLSCAGTLYNAVTGKCYATVIVGVAGTQCADIGMEEAWWTSAAEQTAIETSVLPALGVSSGAETALYYSLTSGVFVWWTHETVTPAVTWAVAVRATDRFASLRIDGMHGSSTSPHAPILCQRDPR